jgi:hypothetical protein
MTSSATRRFPPPWDIIQTPGGYQVVAANRVTVAWVYSRDDLARTSGGSQWLTDDEARRIATGIAKLPNLLARGHPDVGDARPPVRCRPSIIPVLCGRLWL